MPTYSYSCILCEQPTTRLVSIEERDYAENRCDCGGQLQRKIDRPASVYSASANGGQKV